MIDELSAIFEVTSMQTVKFRAGDTIISEGEDGNTAFLIVSGSVEVSVGKVPKAKTRRRRSGAGDVFGEMSLIEPGSAISHCQGGDRCRMPRDHLRRVHPADAKRSAAGDHVHEDAGAQAAAR